MQVGGSQIPCPTLDDRKTRYLAVWRALKGPESRVPAVGRPRSGKNPVILGQMTVRTLPPERLVSRIGWLRRASLPARSNLEQAQTTPGRVPPLVKSFRAWAHARDSDPCVRW